MQREGKKASQVTLQIVGASQYQMNRFVGTRLLKVREFWPSIVLTAQDIWNRSEVRVERKKSPDLKSAHGVSFHFFQYTKLTLLLGLLRPKACGVRSLRHGKALPPTPKHPLLRLPRGRSSNCFRSLFHPSEVWLAVFLPHLLKHVSLLQLLSLSNYSNDEPSSSARRPLWSRFVVSPKAVVEYKVGRAYAYFHDSKWLNVNTHAFSIST